MRALLLEHQPDLHADALNLLATLGLTVDTAPDLGSVPALDRAAEYALAVLCCDTDSRLALSITVQLRRRGVTYPILLTSVGATRAERVLALDTGADDFIRKPYDLAELRARIRALLRRPPMNAPTLFSAGGLTVDTVARRVSRDGRHIALTAKQYALLEYLVRHAGRVVTREELCEHLWDDSHDPCSRAVEVHMSQLRARLGDRSAVSLIATRRRAGYCLLPSSHEPDDPSHGVHVTLAASNDHQPVSLCRRGRSRLAGRHESRHDSSANTGRTHVAVPATTRIGAQLRMRVNS